MFPPETQRISGLLQQRGAYSDHQEGGEGGDLLSDQQSSHLQSNKQPHAKPQTSATIKPSGKSLRSKQAKV